MPLCLPEAYVAVVAAVITGLQNGTQFQIVVHCVDNTFRITMSETERPIGVVGSDPAFCVQGRGPWANNIWDPFPQLENVCVMNMNTKKK
ncbi:jg12844, partial [Pararge aegeria aegeria]